MAAIGYGLRESVGVAAVGDASGNDQSGDRTGVEATERVEAAPGPAWAHASYARRVVRESARASMGAAGLQNSFRRAIEEFRL